MEDPIDKYIENSEESSTPIHDYLMSEEFSIELRKDLVKQEKKEIKRLMLILDKNLQELRGLKFSSKEKNISIIKLQETIMWLGMDLKRLRFPSGAPFLDDRTNNSYVDFNITGLYL